MGMWGCEGLTWTNLFAYARIVDVGRLVLFRPTDGCVCGVVRGLLGGPCLCMLEWWMLVGWYHFALRVGVWVWGYEGLA